MLSSVPPPPNTPTTLKGGGIWGWIGYQSKPCDAHAQKSNSRPYGINRSVINIELKAVHSDYHDGRRRGTNKTKRLWIK